MYVLPSIRNTGMYIYDDMNHNYSDSLTSKIENETDLHNKVVSFLKKRYPYSIFTATLGENQDSSKKRIESHKKGYLRGSPDLIIDNLHKHYTGFAIELKNPKGIRVLSYDQSKMLRQYENNGFVPDHVTFLNQVTYSGNLVQAKLPIERKPNQITFG